MKILIWAVCIIAFSVIQTAIRGSGYILGAIPTVLLYLGMAGLASALCKAWDSKKGRDQYYQRSVSDTSAVDTTWKCTKCGTENSANYSQCKKCGELNTGKQTNVAAVAGTWSCKNCGTENSANYGQCKKCGKFKNG